MKAYEKHEIDKVNHTTPPPTPAADDAQPQ
jgi:hypothetical protein